MSVDNEARDIVCSFDEAVERRLGRYKTLELNADFQPISYFPLSTITWQEIMFLIVKGELTGEPRINIVEEYNEPDAVVRTALREFKIPSVVAHRQMIPRPDTAAFTKFNVFLRDNFTCQYSGVKYDPSELNWDHVVPESKGGKSEWTNIVTAHYLINEKKDNLSVEDFAKLYGYRLKRMPYEPSPYELLQKGRKYPPKYLHESWQDFLYWDSEIEK